MNLKKIAGKRKPAAVGMIFYQEKPRATQKTQLLVLGMIHGRHRDSERYSLETLNSVVESFKPNFWLAEIPPNRLHKAIDTFAANRAWSPTTACLTTNWGREADVISTQPTISCWPGRWMSTVVRASAF